MLRAATAAAAAGRKRARPAVDEAGESPLPRRKPPAAAPAADLLLGRGAPPLPAPPRERFSAASLRDACAHVAAADARLAPLIAQHGPPDRLLARGGSAFASLARSIAFQQLSTKAAATIFGRVLAACGAAAPGAELTPGALLAAPDGVLRECGLSARKVDYLRDLAARFRAGTLSDAALAAADDAALAAALLQVKGLGPWSVDMFAIFHLGNCNVLACGDLGVRKGMARLYDLRALPSPAEMRAIAAPWQPYRSVGTYFMWRVLEAQAAAPKAGGK